MMLTSLLLLQDAEGVAQRGPGPVELWWLWLIVALVAIAVVAWILAHLGPPQPPAR